MEVLTIDEWGKGGLTNYIEKQMELFSVIVMYKIQGRMDMIMEKL